MQKMQQMVDQHPQAILADPHSQYIERLLKLICYQCVAIVATTNCTAGSTPMPTGQEIGTTIMPTKTVIMTSMARMKSKEITKNTMINATTIQKTTCKSFLAKTGTIELSMMLVTMRNSFLQFSSACILHLLYSSLLVTNDLDKYNSM